MEKKITKSSLHLTGIPLNNKDNSNLLSITSIFMSLPNIHDGMLIFSTTPKYTLQKNRPVPTLFENAAIGNPIVAAQNRRLTNHCNRRPIAAFFKNAGIGSSKALG